MILYDMYDTMLVVHVLDDKRDFETAVHSRIGAYSTMSLSYCTVLYYSVYRLQALDPKAHNLCDTTIGYHTKLNGSSLASFQRYYGYAMLSYRTVSNKTSV